MGRRNGAIELYGDRPKEKWPRAADRSVAMVTDLLDIDALRDLVEAGREHTPAK